MVNYEGIIGRQGEEVGTATVSLDGDAWKDRADYNFPSFVKNGHLCVEGETIVTLKGLWKARYDREEDRLTLHYINPVTGERYIERFKGDKFSLSSVFNDICNYLVPGRELKVVNRGSFSIKDAVAGFCVAWIILLLYLILTKT